MSPLPALLWFLLTAPLQAVPHHPDDHAAGASREQLFAVGDHVWLARGHLIGSAGRIIAIQARLFAAEPWVELLLDEPDSHGHRYWVLAPICAIEFVRG